MLPRLVAAIGLVALAVSAAAPAPALGCSLADQVIPLEQVVAQAESVILADVVAADEMASAGELAVVSVLAGSDQPDRLAVGRSSVWPDGTIDTCGGAGLRTGSRIVLALPLDHTNVWMGTPLWEVADDGSLDANAGAWQVEPQFATLDELTDAIGGEARAPIATGPDLAWLPTAGFLALLTLPLVAGGALLLVRRGAPHESG